MAVTVALQAPAAGVQFQCKSGNVYTADANGVVTAAAIGDITDMLNSGCTFVAFGRNNYTAAVAPTTTNDSSQDYAVGSRWFDTTHNLTYTCISNSVGAAVWAVDGSVPGTGLIPPTVLAQFGNSLIGARESGNIYAAAGNPLAANLADTTDDIIAGYAVPASVFDIAGRVLSILAFGQSGATANNKQIKLWINPTMSGQTVTNGVITGGTVTSAGTGNLLVNTGTVTINNKGWNISGTLVKYGAAASNTQVFQGSYISDTTHGGVTSVILPAQTESAIMNIVVTGASGTTGAANDVKINAFELTASN